MTRRPALVAALVLALAGCSGGSHGDDGRTAVPQPTTASPATTTSAAPTPTATPRASTPRPSPARTTPRPTKRPPTVRPAHFPVRVTPGNATQLITVKSSGSRATVTAWAKNASGWHVVAGPWAGRVGSHGVVPGSSRQQGTNTTPGGTFTMTEAFGIAADPGTALPYLHVGNDDWWVEDNNSMYYNSHRRGSQGGFDMSLPESDVNGSERLITHTATYSYAVVVNFNRSPAVRHRGAGIFLHVNGAGATAGCISVPRSAMVTVLRWLRPGAHPRIAIG